MISPASGGGNQKSKERMKRIVMRKLRKYFVVMKVSFANSIAYRANTLARLCFYTLLIYVFTNLWKAIYAEGNVHGYTHTQMVWYLIMTEFIGFACASGVYNTMNDDVKSGAVAYQLGRPMHYVFYQFASSAGQILMNAMVFGVFAVILGFVFVGPLPSFTPREIPALLVSVALSLLLNFFLLMLIGLSAFVIEDNFAIYLIYQKLNFMLGMFLPVEFLPGWLQPIAKSLPFSYVHWAPGKLFVDYSPGLALWLLPIQALWAAGAIAAVLVSYRLCVRRLQVNGG
jgi:ABC-2 type transport system permease protein